MSLQETPGANRIHIGIFGKRNSGKSTLLNAITNQNIAVVSDVAGTTTDPIYKAMELHGIGAVEFIDTAGFDDVGELGKKRIEKTEIAASKADIAIMVFSAMPDDEKEWIDRFKKSKTPVIPVITKADIIINTEEIVKAVFEMTGEEPIIVSGVDFKNGTEKIREAIIRKLPEDYKSESLTGNLVKEGDIVLLVMPQDIQAPKGRLILPQVQVMRDLLDKKCIPVSCTVDKIDSALNSLLNPPKLIITDSQAFKIVYDKKPESSLLTSFSVLLAANKGDIESFVRGAEAIDRLNEDSRVLIAEACTHAPLTEDIGRVKIPNLLRKKIGSDLKIDMVSGVNFPENLSEYDIIIHCGACMFNRKYVLSRLERAKAQNVPMTNYGITIAHLNGILDKITY